MTVHAAFAKELAGPQNTDHSLLLMLGYDREFDLALLNVIDRVGNVALHEHVLILFKSKEALAHAYLGEKVLSVERNLGRFLQSNLLSPKPDWRQAEPRHALAPKLSRGRRDGGTKHARFVVGTQLNIAQLSDNIGNLAACHLPSSPAGWPAEDHRNRGFCFLTTIEPRQKYEQYYTRFHADTSQT
jgi:hypothetical protein